MKLYGLLGKNLSHSFSKKYFSEKFKALGLNDRLYQNIEIADFEKEIPILKKNSSLLGFNITIPYKKAILPYLNKLSETCKKVQACNCVKVDGANWIGHNTDVKGFRQSFEPHLQNNHNKALVLGTGGAAKSVCYVLEQLNIEYLQVSRNPNELKGQIGYQQLSNQLVSEYHVIINTTPVGMYPQEIEKIELPYEAVGNQHYFFDLIYNPAETLFLKAARERGAFTKNGAEMLEIQAEESWKIWNS